MVTVNVAKTVVLNPADQVLLLRRSQTDSRRPGQWDFPGGGVNEGEHHAQAAARELAEEAGITVDEKNFTLVYCATQLYEPAPESVNRALFVCHLSGAQATDVKLSFEHDAYKWVSIEQALVDFPHFFYGAGLRYARDHELLG